MAQMLLPQAWSELSNLGQLLLDHNVLTGSLPPAYLSLENLRILTLGRSCTRESNPKTSLPNCLLYMKWASSISLHARRREVCCLHG